MVFNGTFCAARPSGPTGRANPKQALMIAWTPRRLAARSCILGMSKAELIEGMANLMDDDEEAARCRSLRHSRMRTTWRVN
jgi:hypothetical protein